MNLTPGSSQNVEKKQNTFISPLMLFWAKNKMNMDHQVGDLDKTSNFQQTNVFLVEVNRLWSQRRCAQILALLYTIYG